MGKEEEEEEEPVYNQNIKLYIENTSAFIAFFADVLLKRKFLYVKQHRYIMNFQITY